MPGAEVNGSSANGANANASAGPKFNKDRLDKMRAFFDGYVQRDDLAGMLALVNCHGQDVFRESIGYFDKEAKTPMPFNAIFRIMSMTKPICAVAAVGIYRGELGDGRRPRTGFFLLPCPPPRKTSFISQIGANFPKSQTDDALGRR